MDSYIIPQITEDVFCSNDQVVVRVHCLRNEIVGIIKLEPPGKYNRGKPERE